MHLRTEPNPAVLVLAAALIAWGNFFTYGMYSPTSLRLVTWGCVAAGAAALLGRRTASSGAALGVVALTALLVWQGMTLVRATTYYGTGHWLRDARFVSIAIPTIGAAALFVRRRATLVTTVLVVVFAVGGLWAIWSSPHPAVDVWYLLQHGTSCVVHGCNPYTMHTPASPGVKDGYNYLPASLVLLVPFHVAFGDVRYGELLAVVAAALILVRLTRRAEPPLAALFVCVPGLFFGLEQAWTESLLVFLLVAAVALHERDRSDAWRGVGAGLVFGLALATKQHAWLLLPVAALTLGVRVALISVGTGIACILPWVVVDVGAFWRNTVTMFTHIAPRIDATTLWLHEPAGLQTTLVLIVLAYCYFLVWWSCRGNGPRFLLGSAIVLAGFDLTNKQSFYNQWQLVIWLLIAAAAVEIGTPRREVSIAPREALPIGG